MFETATHSVTQTCKSNLTIYILKSIIWTKIVSLVFNLGNTHNVYKRYKVSKKSEC